MGHLTKNDAYVGVDKVVHDLEFVFVLYIILAIKITKLKHTFNYINQIL